MPRRRDTQSTVLLFGLDTGLADQLMETLYPLCSHVHTLPASEECVRALQRFRPDLVFCSSEPARFHDVLNAKLRLELPVPIVAVSRIPEVSEWLDAMDAGAADYCGAPFESRDIEWILTTNLATSQRVMAVAQTSA